MANRLSKLAVSAFAVTSLMASVAFAQTSQSQQPPMGGSSSGQQMQQPPMGQTGTTGMQQQSAISATVSEVNQQQRTVKLRMQNGETAQFQVPQQLLSQLNQGDSVQVSIRKMQ